MQVGESDSIETLKAILEAETGVASSQQCLLHNGKELLATCATPQTTVLGRISVPDTLAFLSAWLMFCCQAHLRIDSGQHANLVFLP